MAHFVPEVASASHVYYDLARAFVKRGHEVDVLTSYPRRFNYVMKYEEIFESLI